MRHHNSTRKFGRETDQRRALLRSLAVSLIAHNKITTTEAKAKELRPFIEKLTTRARVKTLASQRLLISRLNSEKAAAKLVKVIAPKFEGRTGGYTRVIKLAPRKSDGSKMAVIEFVL